MTDRSTPAPHHNRRTLRLLAAGGATAALLAGGSVAAMAAGTGTATPKPSATATPGTPGQLAPPNGARPSPPVHAPHLDGTVTAVAGSVVTITDHDGFRREIKLSGSTTYRDGLTATPKVGDEIHAEGTVDSDKTTLDATAIGLMTEHAPPGPGRRGPGGVGPAGHGHGGPGAPGAPGPSGTATPRPSGAPTPSPSTNP